MPRTLDRITVDPAIMNGQPCIRGMRLTVRRVLEAAALYPDRNELKSEYPELSDEDIAQALDFAARNLDDQIFPWKRRDSTAARPGATALHGRVATSGWLGRSTRC